jgi:hypothetical protein
MKASVLTQYIAGGSCECNVTGLQAGTYEYTFDTPSTGDIIHVSVGLLIDQIAGIYER